MLAIAASAWVCDDAFITLRSVDNLLAGRGLVFNPEWRVQSFTHPAWMVLLLIARLLVDDPFFAVLACSLIVSGAAIGGALARTERLGAAVIIVACLCASRALVEYSSCGLENSLLHLLLASAVALTGSDGGRQPKAVGRAVLLLSCAALCRPDAVLLFGPLALGSILRARINPSHSTSRTRLIGAIGLGLTPIIVWECFSLLYFGQAIPNTALAKLGGVSAHLRWGQGLRYLGCTLQRDPGTALLCIAGVVVPWIDLRDDSPRRVCLRWLSLGCVLHLLYVVWIGGDFMEGRFLSAPAFVGVLALATLADCEGHRRGLIVWGCVGLIPLAWLGSRHPLRPRAGWGEPPHVEAGIADERAHYREAASLLALDRSRPAAGQLPRHRWRSLGEAGPRRGGSVAVFSTMGYYAYFASPEVHVVDGFALADPLLARLPAIKRLEFRPGHSSRAIPDGYLDTLETGDNRIADPAVAALYDDLRTVHAGPLLGHGRLGAMWRVWTSSHPIDVERYRMIERRRIGAGSLARRGAKGLRMRDAGALIELDRRVSLRINPGLYRVGCEGQPGDARSLAGRADAMVDFGEIPGCAVLLIEPLDMLGRRSTLVRAR